MNKGQSGGWPTGSPSEAPLFLMWPHFGLQTAENTYSFCAQKRSSSDAFTVVSWFRRAPPTNHWFQCWTLSLNNCQPVKLQGFKDFQEGLFFVTLGVHGGSQTNKGKRDFVRFGRGEVRIRNSVCHILYFLRQFCIDNLQQWMKNRWYLCYF